MSNTKQKHYSYMLKKQVQSLVCVTLRSVLLFFLRDSSPTLTDLSTLRKVSQVNGLFS